MNIFDYIAGIDALGWVCVVLTFTLSFVLLFIAFKSWDNGYRVGYYDGFKIKKDKSKEPEVNIKHNILINEPGIDVQKAIDNVKDHVDLFNKLVPNKDYTIKQSPKKKVESAPLSRSYPGNWTVTTKSATRAKIAESKRRAAVRRRKKTKV